MIPLERWRQIEEIYHAARAAAPDHRAAVLREACGADDEMREEVESLLAEDVESAAFFDSPALDPAPFAPTTAPGEMCGRALGAYRLISHIGSGGMGDVYLAEDSRLGRKVAVKVLPAEFACSAARRQRFTDEARAASALNHPEIVTVHDVGECDGVHYIVMEHVGGRTLAARIANGPLEPVQALRYARSIAGAMTVVHAAGILHRDLKPGNVIVTEQDGIKLLDFGLSGISPRAVTWDGRTRAPGASSLLGTAAYTSPERIAGQPADERSDIFSFGAMLHEMATGERPFAGESESGVLHAVRAEAPKPPPRPLPPLAAELCRVALLCLRKDPAERLQSMAAVKTALDEIDVREQARGRRARTRVRVRRGALAIAGLLAAGVALWPYAGRLFGPGPELKPERLTSYPGSETQPSLSPDGRTVAFAWQRPGEPDIHIYTLPVAGGEPHRLTSARASDASPAWSPDGAHIAFVRGSAWRWTFHVVGAAGDGERLVGTSAAPASLVSWTPDGRNLVVTEKSASGRNALYLLPLEGGAKTQLTFPPKGVNGDFLGIVNAPGDRLYFVRATAAHIGDLFAAHLAPGYRIQGEAKQLTFEDGNRAMPALDVDGRGVLFYNGEQAGFWRVLESGRRRIPVSVGVAQVRGIATAVAGRRVVYSVVFTDTNIWSLDLGGKAQPAPLASASTARDEAPAWSPAGDRVAFVSDRNGSPELWVAGRDGAGAVQLTRLGGALLSAPAWRPDGGAIAFLGHQQGKRVLMEVDAGGGPPRRLNAPTEASATYSRDGKWLYTTRFQKGWNVVRISTATGEAFPMTRTGGASPREFADGRYLYYAKRLDLYPDYPAVENALWRMPVDGAEDDAEEISPSLLSGRTFAVARDGVFFIGPQSAGGFPVRHFDAARRRITTVHTLTRPPGAGMDVSPGGRSLLWCQADNSGADLWMLENLR
jgi:eukaryotic-like serine/threonine-protein kinase